MVKCEFLIKRKFMRSNDALSLSRGYDLSVLDVPLGVLDDAVEVPAVAAEVDPEAGERPRGDDEKGTNGPPGARRIFRRYLTNSLTVGTHINVGIVSFIDR